MIDRTTGGTTEIPEETIEMVGSTGNIYSVHICQMPSCTCPDNQKGNQCKHIVYVCQMPQLIQIPTDSYSQVLHNVLKAPDHLQYQLAFISSVSPCSRMYKSYGSPALGIRSYARYLPMLVGLPLESVPQIPKIPQIVKTSLVTALSASQNSSLRVRTLFGARPHAGTIFTKSALSNGQRVRKASGNFDAFSGVPILCSIGLNEF